MISKAKLKQLLALSLEDKVRITEERIIEWYNYWGGNVYVSFSGGKDSTVLLHIVRELYPEIPAVFADTGLEYPEIREFVKSTKNTIWLKPKLNFKQVLEKYGYPIVSKENAQKINEIRNTNSEKLYNKRLYGDDKGHGKLPKKWRFLINAPFKISDRCCYVMKKYPFKKYEKDTNNKPIVGTTVIESGLRYTTYLKTGCNAFKNKRPISSPLSFWIEKDIWKYLNLYQVPYSSIYDKGFDKTGCMFCMFGIHLEKGNNRFQKMKKTHPKQYNYCLNQLGCKKVLDYLKINY